MTKQNLKMIEKTLNERYGAVIGNADLRHVLGYKSFSTFNRAVRMQLVGINIFEIENRRGKFALTQDIATWLYKLNDPRL